MWSSDGCALDATMIWLGAFVLLSVGGVPRAVFELSCLLLRRVRRARLRRRNLAVVAMIANLQAMHEFESGVHRE